MGSTEEGADAAEMIGWSVASWQTSFATGGPHSVDPPDTSSSASPCRQRVGSHLRHAGSCAVCFLALWAEHPALQGLLGYVPSSVRPHLPTNSEGPRTAQFCLADA